MNRITTLSDEDIVVHKTFFFIIANLEVKHFSNRTEYLNLSSKRNEMFLFHEES